MPARLKSAGEEIRPRCCPYFRSVKRDLTCPALTAAPPDRLFAAMFGWLRPVFALLARFGPWMVLAAILFLVGIVLTLLGAVFGFSLDDVDLWLEAHGGFFNAVGNLLFRIGCGFVFLLCLFLALSPLLYRRDKSEERPGWGCALLAIPVGYFAWIGMVSSG